MALRDTWRRALEYFGLVEGDYIEEGEYDEGDTGSEMALDDTAVAPRDAVRTMPARGRGRGREDDIDDIFGEEEPAPARRGRVRAVEDTAEEPRPRRSRRRPGSGGNGGGVASMHVVTPRSFNDAQQVADEFKRSKPVIINLQSTDRELSKRLIDFSSGMTYALGGGMQRIAQGIFLLTPEDVEVSAEEKARILEGGFFNQS
jgi:cell division inhibitor SepF